MQSLEHGAAAAATAAVKTLLFEIIIDRSNYVPTMITMEVITIETREFWLLVGIKPT